MRVLFTAVFALTFYGPFCSPLLAQRPHPPLLITTDHNDDFVITGIGQPVVAMEFSSPDNGFEDAPGSELFQDPETGEFTSSAPAPFSILVQQADLALFSAPPGGSTIVNGSYPLLFGPNDSISIDDVSIQIGYLGDTTPYDNPFGFICETCTYPSATVTPDGGIEVTNINDPIIRISVFSNEGGLLEVTEVPAGASIVKSTATRLVVENPDGFQPMDLESLDFLNGVASSADAFVKFDLKDGTAFGPMPVARAVPEPRGAITVLIGLLGCLTTRRRR